MATFLNPASLSPEYNWKPQGFLAGVMAGQKQDDYRRAMDDQFALQKIGLESAGIDLSEKKAGLPLADLQRQVQMGSARGKLPFAEQMASEAAKANIASSGMEQLMKGPEGQRNLRRTWEEEGKKNTFEQRKREMSVTDSLLQAAQGMDPASARAFLEENYKKFKDRGYDLPRAILDPRQHAGLRRAMVESSQYIREMEKAIFDERMKSIQSDKTRASVERVAQMQADATREAAEARARASALNLTPNKALTILSDPTVDKNSLEYRLAENFLKQYFINRYQSDTIGLKVLMAIQGKKPEEAARIEQEIYQQFSRNTIPNVGGAPAQQAPGSPPPGANVMRFDNQGNPIQ